MTEQREIIGYNAVEFRDGAFTVQKARRAIDSLPVSDEIKEEVLRIAGDITKGTLTASAAIHIPYYDMREVHADPKAALGFGGPRDYQTDTKNLSELPEYFASRVPAEE